MKKKINLKRLVVILSIGLMFLPLLQSVFKPVNVEKLSGAYILPDTVGLNGETWMSGEFQNKYSRFYEYKIGFRSWFVKLRNQVAYSVFNRSTSYVTIGERNNLYDWGCVEAYKGLWDVRPDQVRDTVIYLEALRRALKEKEIELVVVLAPNKVRIDTTILTKEHHEKGRNKSKYDFFCKEMKKYPIHYIDVNSWFLEKKKEFNYPLFSNTGIHWSFYAAAQFSDSLTNYFQTITDEDIYEYNVSSYVQKNDVKPQEEDLMNDLNLVFPFHPKGLAYPVVERDSIGIKTKYKPNVWVVADSYYWTVYGLDMHYASFSPDSEFWFYNNTAYCPGKEPRATETIDKSNIFKDKDIVMLMATETNLRKFPFGFISMFKEQLNLDDRVQAIRSELIMRDVVDKSNDLYNIVSDVQTVKDQYKLEKGVYNIDLQKKCNKATIIAYYQKIKQEKVTFFENQIKSKDEWRQSVIEKGKKLGKTEEQSILDDANYLYDIQLEEKTIDSFGDDYKEVIANYEEIIKDNVYLSKIKKEAKSAHLPLEFHIIGHIDYLIYINQQK